MMSGFSDIAHGLIDLLCLEACRACGKSFAAHKHETRRVEAICRRCWERLFCRPASIKVATDDSQIHIASALPYVGAVKKVIYKLKYDNDRLLANDLSLVLSNTWTLVEPLLPADHRDLIIVPIPLHKDRMRTRGYNQAELICNKLAKDLKISLNLKALKRIRPTLPQHGLGREDRLANLSGAFAADVDQVSTKAVILVDDIHTSGATMSEAARQLKVAGASTIVGVTVAFAI